jgi:hypothetical protein
LSETATTPASKETKTAAQERQRLTENLDRVQARALKQLRHLRTAAETLYRLDNIRHAKVERLADTYLIRVTATQLSSGIAEVLRESFYKEAADDIIKDEDATEISDGDAGEKSGGD